MTPFWVSLLLFCSLVATAYSPTETPQQSLNQYVAFLNQSADVLTNRFQMLRAYQADVKQYRNKPFLGLNLPSSGPLADYYYRKALLGSGLTQAEKQRLNASTEALWQQLTQLDQTGKALETYVRLNAYQSDSLKQSDALVGAMQERLSQLSRDRTAFYQQIQRIYRRYQPYLPTDPYLVTEKEMEQVLLSQQHLLDSLPSYLREDSRSNWPVARVQQSILADEKLLSTFGKAQATIDYPASSAISDFKLSLLAIQALKRRAVDDNTFAARQSAAHGNAVYRSLMNHYNQDLLASHRAFVNYSQSVRRLLDYPAFSPVFTPELSPSATQTAAQTLPFLDKPLLPFATKQAVSPVSRATWLALNGYVEFINESLRQTHLLQVLLRNYQASAEYYRNPSRSVQRARLTYAHDDYKVPLSAYQQLLLWSNQSIPQPYRQSVMNQAEVLLTMLQEIDGLSIELIAYTTQQQYLHDQLQRSDAILDRYTYLFDTFDQKKEQLYTDVRRIHESYPVASPASSWQVAGNALLKTLDDDREILFGVKAYLMSKTARLPETHASEADARQLITDEYQNLKGLQRFGRSNGLCPYSPYEDLAQNSLRLAEMTQKVNSAFSVSATQQYTSFYYFYNNELVYQYNKFAELAGVGVLKAINQPDVFIFRSSSSPTAPTPAPEKAELAVNVLTTSPKPVNIVGQTNQSNTPTAALSNQKAQHDTVYVERARVDTVYLERTGQQTVTRSLTGYATNNMILLLDVSGSMDSPVKLPLLKRSIKSLLPLLRPEDQLSIVIYSGKARVVLKPTSGIKAAEISRVIDELQSTGDTDGNKGLQLAYKVANKHYIRAGNNRIILATDGEFPVSNDVLELIGDGARQDICLTVFTFGRKPLTSLPMKKLSQLGRGTHTHVTAENADLQLIMEAQAKPIR